METGMEIAVIGMAGRCPGAKHTREFWHNLKNGVESITFFSNEDLGESVASPVVLQDPNFVKAFGRLEDVEYFDAFFRTVL